MTYQFENNIPADAEIQKKMEQAEKVKKWIGYGFLGALAGVAGAEYFDVGNLDLVKVDEFIKGQNFTDEDGEQINFDGVEVWDRMGMWWDWQWDQKLDNPPAGTSTDTASSDKFPDVFEGFSAETDVELDNMFGDDTDKYATFEKQMDEWLADVRSTESANFDKGLQTFRGEILSSISKNSILLQSLQDQHGSKLEGFIGGLDVYQLAELTGVQKADVDSRLDAIASEVRVLDENFEEQMAEKIKDEASFKTWLASRDEAELNGIYDSVKILKDEDKWSDEQIKDIFMYKAENGIDFDYKEDFDSATLDSDGKILGKLIENGFVPTVVVEDVEETVNRFKTELGLDPANTSYEELNTFVNEVVSLLTNPKYIEDVNVTSNPNDQVDLIKAIYTSNEPAPVINALKTLVSKEGFVVDNLEFIKENLSVFENLSGTEANDIMTDEQWSVIKSFVDSYVVKK